MQRIYRVNTEKLASKYNKKLYIINLPSMAIILTLFFVTRFNAGVPMSMFYYQVTFYILTIGVGISFISALISALVTNPILDGHKYSTYMEICGSDMVVSQHMESRILSGKVVRFKRLWVMKMADIDDVFYSKKHIIISGKARMFEEREDWLEYERNENGITFNRWWYNENGGKDTGYIEFRDYYPHGKWMTRRIFNTSVKYKQQQERRRLFNDEMMRLAKARNANRKSKR